LLRTLADGTVDTGAADTGAADTGAADTGAADTGAANNGHSSGSGIASNFNTYGSSSGHGRSSTDGVPQTERAGLSQQPIRKGLSLLSRPMRKKAQTVGVDLPVGWVDSDPLQRAHVLDEYFWRGRKWQAAIE